MYRQPEAKNYPAVKAAIGRAFAALRQMARTNGTEFVARQSYLCCRSCAGAALDTPGNQGKPVVYFTRQDAEDLRTTGSVYLAFGYVGGFDEEGYANVGRRVAKAMTEADLEVEWDGTASTRIRVLGLTPPEPDATFLDLVGATA